MCLLEGVRDMELKLIDFMRKNKFLKRFLALVSIFVVSSAAVEARRSTPKAPPAAAKSKGKRLSVVKKALAPKGQSKKVSRAKKAPASKGQSKKVSRAKKAPAPKGQPKKVSRAKKAPAPKGQPKKVSRAKKAPAPKEQQKAATAVKRRSVAKIQKLSPKQKKQMVVAQQQAVARRQAAARQAALQHQRQEAARQAAEQQRQQQETARQVAAAEQQRQQQEAARQAVVAEQQRLHAAAVAVATEADRQETERRHQDRLQQQVRQNAAYQAFHAEEAAGGARADGVHMSFYLRAFDAIEVFPRFTAIPRPDGSSNAAYYSAHLGYHGRATTDQYGIGLPAAPGIHPYHPIDDDPINGTQGIYTSPAFELNVRFPTYKPNYFPAALRASLVVGNGQDEVRAENIESFFIIQSISSWRQGTPFLLRPHYKLSSDEPFARPIGYNKNFHVHVGVFSDPATNLHNPRIEGQPVNALGQPNGLFEENVSIHSGQALQLVSSGNTSRIIQDGTVDGNLDITQTHILSSLTKYRDPLGQLRAAVVKHILLNEQDENVFQQALQTTAQPAALAQNTLQQLRFELRGRRGALTRHLDTEFGFFQ
jgi:chemotaxis protein histidine kinase CheA